MLSSFSLHFNLKLPNFMKYCFTFIFRRQSSSIKSQFGVEELDPQPHLTPVNQTSSPTSVLDLTMGANPFSQVPTSAGNQKIDGC